MALAILCTPTVSDPHIVTMVCKEELESLLVLVLDPRGSILLIRVLNQDGPFVLNIFVGWDLEESKNVAVGGCHFVI